MGSGKTLHCHECRKAAPCLDEIERLRKQISQHLQKYQDLIDISLDKLRLSFKEVRMNITPRSPSTIFLMSWSSTSAARSRALRNTPQHAAAKRKRTVLEESDERSVSDFMITSSFKGDFISNKIIW